MAIIGKGSVCAVRFTKDLMILIQISMAHPQGSGSFSFKTLEIRVTFRINRCKKCECLMSDRWSDIKVYIIFCDRLYS